jgi:hypothetical protein
MGAKCAPSTTFAGATDATFDLKTYVGVVNRHTSTSIGWMQFFMVKFLSAGFSELKESHAEGDSNDD